MIVLDMNQPLTQNLLGFFLRNRGFRIETRETVRPSDWPSTVLITDKSPNITYGPAYGYQIWLVDSKKIDTDKMPPYVKAVVDQGCQLPELESCIQQVLLRQYWIRD